MVEGDLAPPAGGESAAGAPSGAPLGKWARGSLVGAVRTCEDWPEKRILRDPFICFCLGCKFQSREVFGWNAFG